MGVASEGLNVNRKLFPAIISYISKWVSSSSYTQCVAFSGNCYDYVVGVFVVGALWSGTETSLRDREGQTYHSHLDMWGKLYVPVWTKRQILLSIALGIGSL